LVINSAPSLVLEQTPPKFPRLNWTHSFLVVSLHVCGLLGLYFKPRPVDLALFLGLYLATTFAIGIGYQRLLTHRGWRCSSAGGPARWVTIHRRHHRLTDQVGDPHSPLMGFLHAHVRK